jgi:hypothetical protein
MVYEDVSDLIISAADGYNVCIIAYGQTGSGKTFTMMGSPEQPGINIRALKELFHTGEARAETMSMSFSASILEIYNESIFDLLSAVPRESAAKLDIKEMKYVPVPHDCPTIAIHFTHLSTLVLAADTSGSPTSLCSPCGPWRTWRSSSRKATRTARPSPRI